MAYPGQTFENPVTGQTLNFLATTHQTGGAELVVVSSYGGRSPEPVPHYHPRQEELFEVLQGELSVRLDGQLRTVTSGESLRIAPGQVHTTWNELHSLTVVRWTTRPALRSEELLETLFTLAQAGLVTAKGAPDLLQTSLLIREFHQEIRLDKPARWLQHLVFGLLRPIARMIGLRAVYAPTKAEREAVNA